VVWRFLLTNVVLQAAQYIKDAMESLDDDEDDYDEDEDME
jgi:hypothetical protein